MIHIPGLPPACTSCPQFRRRWSSSGRRHLLLQRGMGSQFGGRIYLDLNRDPAFQHGILPDLIFKCCKQYSSLRLFALGVNIFTCTAMYCYVLLCTAMYCYALDQYYMPPLPIIAEVEVGVDRARETHSSSTSWAFWWMGWRRSGVCPMGGRASLAPTLCPHMYACDCAALD